MSPTSAARILAPVILPLIAACAGRPFLQDPRGLADDLASSAGLQTEWIEAGGFKLLVRHRGLSEANGPLAVYLEGDGHAWSTRTRASRDPTPWNPIGLRLAVRDPSPSVLYVARPCQYAEAADLEACPPRYWTSHRFAEEVVEAVDRAVTWALRRPRKLALIGYSGGGALAVLVAARRSDVAWLATVAGNLDHTAWTRLHGLTPLHGSLNPADAAEGTAAIPQVHLVGGRDDNMPMDVAKAFAARMLDPSPKYYQVVSEFGHRCCWAENWPDILCRHQTWGAASCRR